jgi:hypothetical protein
LLEHWIDWWTPVCESVGLPLPVRQRASRLGRFAQAISLTKSTGHPFALTRVTVHRAVAALESLDGFETVEFRRGFPEYLRTYNSIAPARPFLRRWAGLPLTGLRLTGLSADDWDDGPHLAGVSALELDALKPDALGWLLRSRHLTSLENLTLMTFAHPTHTGRMPLVELAASPLAARLKRLSVPAFDDESIAALDGGFPNLTALEVEFHPEGVEVLQNEIDHRLAWLGMSPKLAGLRELDLIGGFSPHALRDAAGASKWKQLRRLSLDFRYADMTVLALPDPEHLPALEDLSIAGVWATPQLLDVLIASPLTKQLRHFALTLWRADAPGGADWRRMADIVDPAKIETFWLDADHAAPGIHHLLRQRLGDKLRRPR